MSATNTGLGMPQHHLPFMDKHTTSGPHLVNAKMVRPQLASRSEPTEIGMTNVAVGKEGTVDKLPLGSALRC